MKGNKATAGEKIVKAIFNEWRVPWDQRDNVSGVLGRKIDRLIARERRKERERVSEIVDQVIGNTLQALRDDSKHRHVPGGFMNEIGQIGFTIQQAINPARKLKPAKKGAK